MSRVQPPGRLLGLGSRPFGAKTPGCGHVRASFGMYCSIENGAFTKWLANGGVVFVHVADNGGDVKFTSFWSRHWYAAPDCPTCVVCEASAFARPLTPSQPP